MNYLVAILGLAVLMIVLESGHYFAARAFGMRVLKFSIGFGPAFFRVEPHAGYWTLTFFGDRARIRLRPHDPERHGPTVFQVAAIPFLAYVQIAGMNPMEEVDPRDKGAYPNASLWGRIVTIFAGPLANYLFASVFFFIPLYADGKMEPGDPTEIAVSAGMTAEAAGLKNGDRILAIDGKKVATFEEMAAQIVASADKAVSFELLRDGQPTEITITPTYRDECKKVCIGVTPNLHKVDASFSESAAIALKTPPKVVKSVLTSLAQLVQGKGDDKLGGPAGMVKEMKKVADRGWADFLGALGYLSTMLAAFNMLPVPALDGGRLMFLGYEAATRRRANPTVEAHIHAIGLVMMLGLMIYVTFANDLGFASK